MSRRPNDQYFTPAWATRCLLDYITPSGLVIECCVGEGSIRAELLKSGSVTGVHSNDIDRQMVALTYVDVSLPDSWNAFPQMDWVISNPPFNQAAAIVPLAHAHARAGIAMLLRLSWLEPALNRDRWLASHPPNKLIVLPRISFTGDGRTDRVTCAWMIWEKVPHPDHYIKVIPREGR